MCAFVSLEANVKRAMPPRIGLAAQGRCGEVGADAAFAAGNNPAAQVGLRPGEDGILEIHPSAALGTKETKC